MLKITDVDWIGDKNSGLAVATQIQVTEKITHFILQGSVPANWHEIASNFAGVIAERADILLYPSTKKQLAEAEEILHQLTTAIAILAFVKGGIEIFGTRYEVNLDGGET